MTFQFALTTAHSQVISVIYTNKKWGIDLLPDIQSSPTRLNRTLRRNLRINNQVLPETGAVTCKENSVTIILDMNESIELAKLTIAGNEIVLTNQYQLSPIEARFLARNKQLLPQCVTDSTLKVSSDLHTHFAGCVYAEDLIRIGKECDVSYPSYLLEEIGIHGYSEAVPLRSMSTVVLNTLQENLHIPLDRQITFVQLEKIYRLRSPITKSFDCFIPLIEQLASDYSSMGISYCEISFTDIVKTHRLLLLQKYLSDIEKRFNITIRFLAAIGRSDDPEWDFDYIERLKELRDCPWIVGVDFLGHEINSTNAIARYIRTIAEWAHIHRSQYVIRVHAGENPAHPENIRVALEAVQGKNVDIRIGHGIYGCDDRTIALLKQENATVEFNVNSNYALNNIHDCRKLPLRYYISKGIRVVLGTDGYGIYQTDSIQETKAALLSGITVDDLKLIIKEECHYIQEKKRAFHSKHFYEIPSPMKQIHFTDEIMNRRTEQFKAQKQRLIDTLHTEKITPLSYSEFLDRLNSVPVLSIAGAWQYSWEKITASDKRHIEDVLTTLFSKLPQKTVIITGGTSLGLEGVVHSIAEKSGHQIIGTLVNDIDLQVIDTRITAAHMIADQFYNKAARLYLALKECDGVALFIGGGDIVADEIQTVHNIGVRYLLMKGPEGAANDYSFYRPQHSFTTADEILQTLDGSIHWTSSEGHYWHVGVNPTADAVITRINPRSGERELLMIKRRSDALTEPGKWALPGGFVHTESPLNSPWEEGFESPREACLRELYEETLLDLRNYQEELQFQFEIEKPGRDPRDTDERWSRTSVFSMELNEELASSPICGNDDAEEAAWCELRDLPWNIAFDHREIIERIFHDSKND